MTASIEAGRVFRWFGAAALAVVGAEGARASQGRFGDVVRSVAHRTERGWAACTRRFGARRTDAAGLLTVAVVLLQSACNCPPYCGEHPPPATCSAGTVPQVVYEKAIEYEYNVQGASTCDPVGLDTMNQGVALDGALYRAVAGCDSKVHLSTLYAQEDMYPPGSETGLAIGMGMDKRLSGAPFHSLLGIEWTTGEPYTYHPASVVHPSSGLAHGTGSFCFGTNVTPTWWQDNVGPDNISASGSYKAYLEVYLPLTRCVPPELAQKSILVSSAGSVTGVRPTCTWTGGGGTPAPSFPVPHSTFEGCAADPTACQCDSESKCNPHPYQEWHDGQCNGFAWECWCDC